MGALVTVDTSDWFDEISMFAPGVSTKGMKQAMSSAVRLFCERSGAWVVELWDAQDGQPVPFAPARFIDLQAKLQTRRDLAIAELEEGAVCPVYESGNPATPWSGYHTVEEYWPWDVLYVMGATYYEVPVGMPLPYTGTPLAPVQTPQSRNVYTNSEPAADGPPRTYRTFVERPGVIELMPPGTDRPGVTGIVPTVALQVPMDCCTSALPVVFKRYWYQVILDGALATLFSQPDKPYTNLLTAEYRARSFRAGMSAARDTARRQMNTSDTQWQFPRWAT